MKCVFRMEETKASQLDQELEEKFNEEVDKIVESGKKKRKLSEAQLATLAAGRRKRWEKKQVENEKLDSISEEKEEKDDIEVGEKQKKKSKTKSKVQIKEEPPSSDDSDIDDYSHSSGGEENSEGVSDSSSTDEYVSYPSASDESSDSDLSSADEVDSPPPIPALKRQKARDLTAEKNARSARKMKEYIKKRTLTQLSRPQQLFL